MAHLIPIDSIVVAENRQRQYHSPEAHAELINSISGPSGLMHALVVRTLPDDKYQLVAGERRLRAIKDIIDLGGSFFYGGQHVPPGFVPANHVGDLDPVAAEEAELDENIRRLDLTWQERIDAWGRLHDLRKTQAANEGKTHSVADTATELFGRSDGDYQSKVAVALNLRQNLTDPEVREAKSVKEAVKVLERKDRERENRVLAQQMDKVQSPHTLIRGDCTTVPLGDIRATVVITDPPYGMGADEFADGGGAVIAAHNYADDEQTFTRVVLPGIGRALLHTTPQAHAYIFCDFARFQQLSAYVRGQGWEVFRTPLIWVKNNGRVPLPKHGPRRMYECILYARKGNKEVSFIGDDVLVFPSDENLGMSAQKPVALYAELLRRSVRPGDLVLDPFCGTGPVFPAADAAKCHAIGIEMNETTADIAARRIRGSQ